ncbi:MAG: hypothetical protein J6Z49_06070 [Kiritimatiellae bacterium]|nr:hypothetical protein [Kiritimatiellia bacterium]
MMLFEIVTPDGASKASADTYAANDESVRPFIGVMRNERKSVVSGKSNDAAEDTAVNVATVVSPPCFENALTVADAEAPAPE